VCNVGFTIDSSSKTCKANTPAQTEKVITTDLLFGDMVVNVGDAMTQKPLDGARV
jgi:hypothetical protein